MFKRAALAGATLAMLAGVGVGSTAVAHAATTPRVKGLDVSSYQHPGGQAINWREVVHYGYKFVFIKATEGTYYVNSWYKTDAAGARQHGMHVGSYAFAVPNRSSGASQANYLLSHGGYSAGMIAPTLDIEWNPYGSNCYGMSATSLRNWITQFEATIHSRIGQYAIINTPSSWWNSCTGKFHASQYPLWDENNHNSTPSSPVLPAGWTTWSYWQNSITGHIPGVPATVDIDTTN